MDVLKAMKTYKEVGFDGPIDHDHTPHIDNNTEWDHRGKAYAIGYMKALLDVINAI